MIFLLVLAVFSWAMVAPLRIPRPTGWKMLVFAAWMIAVFIFHAAKSGA